MKNFIVAICLLAFAPFAAAQTNVITGKVIDESNNEPLVGANVSIGSATKAVSDIDGNFTIKGLDKDVVELTASYIGYENATITVNPTNRSLVRISMSEAAYMADEVIVASTRVDEKSPTANSTIEKEEIEKQNYGQGLPLLLNWSPSLVTTSDAGAGVGYTGLRIRGSDASRINVTINGVPLNDSESQGVFWVNIPDIGAASESIQIQRGVGTSTNGAGAFGGSVNLQTNTLKNNAYGEVTNAYGSYDTWRHTVGFGTGLLKDKWSFDGRVSKIKSDGYIDRASSDLSSYYFSGGYYGKNTLIKAIVFGGKERTYQSWYGTPEAVIDNDSEGIDAVIANNGLDAEQAENIRNSDRTYNWYLYDDQVDDYAQDHYQLHLSQKLNESLTGNVSLHYTYGRGFYEEFKRGEDFADYNLPNVVIGTETIESTDLVRRRWLDNDFYGFTYSLNYEKENWSAILGGAYNQYRGGHFGEIIWAEYSSTAFIEDRYYDNDGDKNDFNTYLKVNVNLNDELTLFGDLQYRNIQYDIAGVDSDLRMIDISDDFSFFNPKVGVNFEINAENSVYASYAVANREPVRGDFIDAIDQPKHETLGDLEVGYRMSKSNFKFNANAYYMNYKDQLVLTGAVNDVGSNIRTNVDKSYRAGIELIAGLRLAKQLTINANLTLSKNKIDEFTEVIYDYGPAFDEYIVIENDFTDTDISFSPNVIAGSQIAYTPVEGLEFALLSKYVGKQYLDNTSNDARSIDAYFVNDIRLSYRLQTNIIPEIGLSLLVNNVFNELYSSNGYTFGYQAGDDYMVRENYYYPQAETNVMASVTLKF